MDPYEIEDTSHWEGCPTRLETVKHYASMLEDNIEELKRQLQTAKENIASLVEMNDRQTAELWRNKAWMANLEAETTEQLNELSSLRVVQSQNDTLRQQLQAARLNSKESST
ncbi:hypothetical protein ACQKP5_28655 [Pseudomonas vancouverensis]|uniref:hypothetical protein n=1 Tax=Pseudomonas vancouverensis TaxID=95300 RepID=UPI003D0746A9